ncbi:hypothetical protein HYW32_01130 [Candidatus Berkelbacteria bacterium]|nr:hypothetical protein [Candidatus Berkelbacteria bacterium]
MILHLLGDPHDLHVGDTSEDIDMGDVPGFFHGSIVTSSGDCIPTCVLHKKNYRHANMLFWLISQWFTMGKAKGPNRMVDMLGKSLHRLEQLILGWAEQITLLATHSKVC